MPNDITEPEIVYDFLIKATAEYLGSDFIREDDHLPWFSLYQEDDIEAY